MKPRHDYPPGDDGYRQFVADLLRAPPVEQQEALDATTSAEEARHHAALGEAMRAQGEVSAHASATAHVAAAAASAVTAGAAAASVDDPLTAVHHALAVAEAAALEAARSVLGSTAAGSPVLTPIRLAIWRDLLASLETCRGTARRASADATQRAWRWDGDRGDWDHGRSP